MTKANLIIMVYFLALAIYGIAEIILQRKLSNWKSAKQEKGFIMLIVSFYLSIYIAPLEFVLLKPGIILVSVLTGFSILFIGILLRFIGYYILGENFSVAIETKANSKLVVNGIYKYIRHPLYLATLIISISGCIVFSCLFIRIFVILTLTGIVIRIKKEESFLSGQFQEFGEYKKRIYKLIPFVY